jgi:hypothetical protein
MRISSIRLCIVIKPFPQIQYEVRFRSFVLQKNVRVSKMTRPSSIGSGPFWDTVSSRSIYFTDYVRSTVRRYEIDTKKEYSAKLGNVWRHLRPPIVQ